MPQPRSCSTSAFVSIAVDVLNVLERPSARLTDAATAQRGEIMAGSASMVRTSPGRSASLRPAFSHASMTALALDASSPAVLRTFSSSVRWIFGMRARSSPAPAGQVDQIIAQTFDLDFRTHTSPQATRRHCYNVFKPAAMVEKSMSISVSEMTRGGERTMVFATGRIITPRSKQKS
ncbi:Hypothetical protein NGAL_HAMBI490_27500 [Neorhizobium galegae bv. officinalis]|nr:Hypothetical protein NGAL_HAMBI490_27500 [Neorhizobium galegae bv. officinalis]